MKYTDKTIGFAPDLVPLVLNGSKTLTYRLGSKWDFLAVGDTILTDDSGTSKVFAELEITSKETGTFGTLRDDREGHEMYRTPEERRATFEKYYKRPVSDNEPAVVLGFKVVRRVENTEEDIVQIVETTPEILEKAQFYLNLIKRIVPNATVSLIGSLAIPISTKNEMDILIEIDGGEDILTIQEKIRDESEGVFGVGPIADGEGFSRSKKKYGIICELHILHKGNAKIQSYQELVRRFRADPDLAAKYEKLKRSLNGVPSNVYKNEKSRFLKDNNLI